jgi:Na+-transporting methylmalonyl-CoA/oxaloacetate decarboxylase gamma subunit
MKTPLNKAVFSCLFTLILFTRGLGRNESRFYNIFWLSRGIENN